jgi:hypothetical protein
MFSNISRLHSTDHSSKQNEIVEQRKSLPSTIVPPPPSSSSSNPQLQRSSSATKKNTSTIMDREAQDIEKLYMELKAKQSIEKRKK